MPLELIKDWLKVEKVIQETPDTKTLSIKLTKPINFIPGQFVMAGLTIGDKLVKRAFSIASSPLQKEYIDITFNLYPSGQLSPHMYNLKEGGLVYIEGPYGKFNFSESLSKHFVFIGAGTGISPLMSMIRYMIGKKMPEKKTLIYSVKKPENIVYCNELLEMGKGGELKLFLTITRPEQVEWDGLTGRIDSKMISDCVGNLEKAAFYMCGPPEMVEGTVKILEELGIKKENINREQW